MKWDEGETMRLSLLFKRIIDIVISAALIIILAPLFIIIGILIKLDSRGPAVFTQERAGLNGMPFKIYKFRTMVQNAEKLGSGLSISRNDSRITKVGSFLRDWSLDELPQLFNILKGDMSIIGPRPTLMYQVERYNPVQRTRLNMKPGVTGWAQVNGRNALRWTERISLDIWYVDNWSLLLDLRILLCTIRVVIKREGVYGDAEDHISKLPEEE